MFNRFNDSFGFPLWMKLVWLVIFLVNIALISFGVWVIVKLLQHFGVL